MSVVRNPVPRIYTLVDEQGGGILMPWAKDGVKSGDVTNLLELFNSVVKYFLYNDGRGKFLPIAELVTIRNKQRNAILSTLRRKKGKGKSGPNILEEFDQSHSNGNLHKALKVLDGFGNSNREIKYRVIVWDLNERGNMGETLLHLCLLHNTIEHKLLAKQLVLNFPKLANDIFISEEYYGLSALHEAIVNEDIEMQYFLLKAKADVHQRCYGAFFCAEDQRDSRRDSIEHEWVDLQPNTKYLGRMYFGETPLAFAVCTNQPDSVRLLCAFKADPNTKDTNGNTTLHMCVIHEFKEMLELLHSLGGKLHITNNQRLTPLGLAAKLAKKNMFDAILDIEKETIWTYRETVCVAYPLRWIDTIDEITGHVNQTSALSLVVYGEKIQHLDFFDNLIDELIQKKWNAFGKRKLIQSVIGYTIYLISFCLAFVFRSPNAPKTIQSFVFTFNEHLYSDERCFLWSYADVSGDYSQRIRLFCELIAVASSFFQFVNEMKQINHSGIRRWWKTIKAFPGKIVHKTSFMIILLMLPLRMICSLSSHIVGIENMLAIIAALTTSMHCLFFLRALKFIGPFILMVYKIILNDIIRFLLIYSIFIISFSQAFFLIFQSCKRNSEVENVFSTPGEALLRMFIMSVGEFTAVYRNLHDCKTSIGVQGKILFVIYELLVTIMLLNLLIAMMTRTYEKISETQKEWKRQWAQVILMLEQTISPFERLQYMLQYSRPLTTDRSRRAMVVRLQKQMLYKQMPQNKKTTMPKKTLQRLLTLTSLNVRRRSAPSDSDFTHSTNH